MKWITAILLLLLPCAAMATPNPVTAPAVATAKKETPVVETAPTAPELTAEQRQAKALYNEGIAAYTAGDFNTALTKFQDATALDSNETLRWNIARTQHELGRYTDAIAGYERWLGANPTAPETERKLAESHLLTARANLARTNRLAAEKKAREQELARAKAAMRPTPAPKTAPASVPDPVATPLDTQKALPIGGEPFYERAPSWRSYTALGFAVGGLALGIRAGNEVHYAEAGIEITRENHAIIREGEYRDYADQQRTLQIVGYTAFGVGLAYAIADWIWLNEPDSSIAVVPTANDKGSAGAAIIGRF